MKLKEFFRRYHFYMGLFLVADGLLSFLFFLQQPWYDQVGRLVRLGIGLILLAL